MKRVQEHAVVLRGHGRHEEGPLFVVGRTTHHTRLFAHAAQGRHQDTHEQGDNGNHHQQFNQSKAFSFTHKTSPSKNTFKNWKKSGTYSVDSTQAPNTIQ